VPAGSPLRRLHAVHVLREWGLRDLADDAQMIVSELITNAIDASTLLPERPPVTVRLLLTGRSLVIEVWDHSPLCLQPREADADDEYGRGLTVVAALSQRWGWERTGDARKVVWAELALMDTVG
jgi:anti-sigma regulatory factor (Ser/Thr protein kinase)